MKERHFFHTGMCLAIGMVGLVLAGCADEHEGLSAVSNGPGAVCSSWTMTNELHSNSNQRSLGCVNRRNLAKMVAQPSDLAAGRPLGPANGARESLAVDAYEQGKIKPLSSGQSTGGAAIVMPNIGVGTTP